MADVPDPTTPGEPELELVAPANTRTIPPLVWGAVAAAGFSLLVLLLVARRRPPALAPQPPDAPPAADELGHGWQVSLEHLAAGWETRFAAISAELVNMRALIGADAAVITPGAEPEPPEPPAPAALPDFRESELDARDALEPEVVTLPPVGAAVSDQ